MTFRSWTILCALGLVLTSACDRKRSDSSDKPSSAQILAAQASQQPAPAAPASTAPASTSSSSSTSTAPTGSTQAPAAPPTSTTAPATPAPTTTPTTTPTQGGGTTATPTPTPTPTAPTGGVAILPVKPGTHLLISEVCVKNTDNEYIEIHNPTAQAIDLSNVYLTDGHKPTAAKPQLFWNITTGAGFGGGTANKYDFHVRFPQGSSIGPGQRQTICFEAAAYVFVYAKQPTFTLEQAGVAVGVQSMVPVAVGSIGAEAGLSNTAETIVLYTWDGKAAIVTDIDILRYGTSNPYPVDRSGLPGYKNDTSPASQFVVKVHPSAYDSITRIDDSEGQQTQTGGNGQGGRDETSEDLNNSFDNLTKPTPGS